MKNRAKCKLCDTVIESFHSTDYVICNCGEIAVDQGDAMRCAAKNWDNFIRIDDDGKEIPVNIKEEDVKPIDIQEKPTKKELLEMLDEMVKSYDNLPPQAMNAPVTNYDMSSALLLLSAILRAD